MRDKLLEEILCILTGESIDTEKVRSRLYILLSKYEMETTQRVYLHLIQELQVKDDGKIMAAMMELM